MTTARLISTSHFWLGEHEQLLVQKMSGKHTTRWCDGDTAALRLEYPDSESGLDGEVALLISSIKSEAQVR